MPGRLPPRLVCSSLHRSGPPHGQPPPLRPGQSRVCTTKTVQTILSQFNIWSSTSICTSCTIFCLTLQLQHSQCLGLHKTPNNFDTLIKAECLKQFLKIKIVKIKICVMYCDDKLVLEINTKKYVQLLLFHM